MSADGVETRFGSVPVQPVVMMASAIDERMLRLLEFPGFMARSVRGNSSRMSGPGVRMDGNGAAMGNRRMGMRHVRMSDPGMRPHAVHRYLFPVMRGRSGSRRVAGQQNSQTKPWKQADYECEAPVQRHWGNVHLTLPQRVSSFPWKQ